MITKNQNLLNDIMLGLEKLAVPLAAASVIVTGSIYLSSLNEGVKTNAEDIKEHSTIQKKVYNRLNDLDQRLSRIEGKLDMIIKDQ